MGNSICLFFFNGSRDEEDEYEKMKAQYEAMLALSQGAAALPEEPYIESYTEPYTTPYVSEPGRPHLQVCSKDQRSCRRV
jgi:hypothetical protein